MENPTQALNYSLQAENLKLNSKLSENNPLLSQHQFGEPQRSPRTPSSDEDCPIDVSTPG